MIICCVTFLFAIAHETALLSCRHKKSNQKKTDWSNLSAARQAHSVSPVTTGSTSFERRPAKSDNYF